MKTVSLSEEESSLSPLLEDCAFSPFFFFLDFACLRFDRLPGW